MLAASMKKKTKSKPNPLHDHPMNQITRGDLLWDDDFVKDMAEGKKPKHGGDWAKITKPNIKDEEEEIESPGKPRTFQEAMERAGCPKYHDVSNPFKLFDDAEWYSDGEDVKWFNIKCGGTETSPCSFCSDKNKVVKVKAGVYTPSPSPVKPPAKSEFVQAKGYNKDDYEGEEDSPKKMAPRTADFCKWCQWDPCILKTDHVNEEARMLVDNLIAQEKQGIDITFKNYRFALYRMYARVLGFKQKRYILPVCVQLFIDDNFVEPGEERTGFKRKRDS